MLEGQRKDKRLLQNNGLKDISAFFYFPAVLGKKTSQERFLRKITSYYKKKNIYIHSFNLKSLWFMPQSHWRHQFA